jgi:hypothetical protein
LDTQRLRELLNERDEVDADIVRLVNGGSVAPTPTTETPEKKERAPQKCSICGSLEHSKRRCPQKGETNGTVETTIRHTPTLVPAAEE